MIAASGLKDLALELTSRLDLPDTLPNGVAWSPFVTGFPVGRHYVLAKTFVDDKASRAGMVFTHALIAPIDEMVEFANLDSLMQLLPRDLLHDAIVEQLIVENMDRKWEDPDEEQLAIAKLLVSSSVKPVVRLGHIGFEQTVSRLWTNLWPSIRRQFAFRLSFSPEDLVDVPVPTLVCTPPNLAARWSGYPLISQELSTGVLTSAAALLVGCQKGEEIRTVASHLQVEISSFHQLALLDRMDSLTESAGEGLNTDIAKVRLLEVVADGKPNAATGREELLKDLVRQLKNAKTRQIRALRNIVLTCFVQPDRVWNGIREWVESYSFPTDDDIQFVEIICDAAEEGRATPEWRSAVTRGLSSAKSKGNKNFAHAFWRYMNSIKASQIHCLLDGLALQASDELPLAEEVPESISPDISEIVLEVVASKRLYLLHAVIASLVFDPGRAVRMQLKLGGSAASELTNLKLALRKATSAQIVSIALSIDDRLLIEIAAEVAATDPGALRETDMKPENAQELWRLALHRNLQAWQGPNSPKSELFKLFDLALHTRVSSELIDLLSRTPLANLADYERRAELWPVLTEPARQRFINATADHFLQNVATDVPHAIEPEIQRQLLSSGKLEFALREAAPQSFDNVLSMLSQISLLDEKVLEQMIPALTTKPLADQHARGLGAMINARHWPSCAEHIAGMVRRGRSDLKPALQQCQNLLGFWTQLRLGLGIRSVDEKWDALANLCADLYPYGPDDREVWKRAGGNNADLIHHGDGRTRWADAIWKIRRGHHVRIWNLLAKMREDFPWNDDLGTLGRDSEFAERHW